MTAGSSQSSGRHPKRPHRAGEPPGVISRLELYTIEEAKARLRWSDSVLRAAKRRGLRLIICGKRRYLSGREIFRFLEAEQTTEPR